MLDEPLDKIIFLIVFFLIFFLIISIMKCLKDQKKFMDEQRQRNAANGNVDVWSITGNRPNTSETTWPTHNGHVSIDSFIISPDRLHADKTTSPPPPAYSELGLPTYEEAIKSTTQKTDETRISITNEETS